MWLINCLHGKSGWRFSHFHPPPFLWWMIKTKRNCYKKKKPVGTFSLLPLLNCESVSASLFFLLLPYYRLYINVRKESFVMRFFSPTTTTLFFFFSLLFFFVTRSCLNVGYYAVYIYTYHVEWAWSSRVSWACIIFQEINFPWFTILCWNFFIELLLSRRNIIHWQIHVITNITQMFMDIYFWMDSFSWSCEGLATRFSSGKMTWSEIDICPAHRVDLDIFDSWLEWGTLFISLMNETWQKC